MAAREIRLSPRQENAVVRVLELMYGATVAVAVAGMLFVLYLLTIWSVAALVVVAS